MQTTIKRPTTQELKDQDHEHYLGFERQRLLTDEVTLGSERLDGAMENRFEYTLDKDDELWFQGERLREIFENAIVVAEQITRVQPAFMIELIRRRIERLQFFAQREFIKSELAEDYILVHVSIPPEVVMNGSIDLNAYDRKRGKVMVRTTEKIPNGAAVTSFSLDKNNRLALMAMSDAFDQPIPEEASSEDVMQINFLMKKTKAGDQPITSFLRNRHDSSLTMQFGGQWYAGRQDVDRTHTLEHILKYPDKVEEHVDQVDALKRTYGVRFRDTQEYKLLTDNFVALMKRLRRDPDYQGSSGDAGDGARASGEDLGKSDCPTGVNSPSAQEALSQQGIGNKLKPGEKIWMGCPFCGFKTYGDPCASHLLCSECKAEARDGKIISKGIGRKAVIDKYLKEQEAQSRDEPVSESERKPTLEEKAKLMYGEYAISKILPVFGGARVVAFDRRTNEELGEL
jgi:hypothetical protein